MFMRTFSVRFDGVGPLSAVKEISVSPPAITGRASAAINTFFDVFFMILMRLISVSFVIN